MTPTTTTDARASSDDEARDLVIATADRREALVAFAGGATSLGFAR